jgi:hypothetical protein
LLRIKALLQSPCHFDEGDSNEVNR